MEDKTARDNLGWLFDSGFPPPDLKIATSTRTFDVHKNVVCEACPFIKAACDHDWTEARTGVIHLPEDESIVANLLRYCYSGRIPEKDECGEKCQSRATCLQRDLSILIAADKYQLNSLCDGIQARIDGSINKTDCAADVDMGIWVYQGDRRRALPSSIIGNIVSNIAFEMHSILARHPEAWEKLNSSPELLKDVVRWVAKRPGDVERRDFGWDEPSYLQDTGFDEKN